MKVCPKCGANLNDEVIVCTECGALLSGGGQEAQEVQETQEVQEVQEVQEFLQMQATKVELLGTFLFPNYVRLPVAFRQ